MSAPGTPDIDDEPDDDEIRALAVAGFLDDTAPKPPISMNHDKAPDHSGPSDAPTSCSPAKSFAANSGGADDRALTHAVDADDRALSHPNAAAEDTSNQAAESEADDGGGGFLPETEQEGGFILEDDEGGGFIPEETDGQGGGFVTEEAADGHETRHGPQPPAEAASGNPESPPAVTIQPPTWNCPEYRVVPVGGFVPSKRRTPEGQSMDSKPILQTANTTDGGFKCCECGENSYHTQYFDSFNVLVCKPCCAVHEEKYKLMTKTTAKEEFLLTDADFEKLGFITRKNPRKEGWNQMKLFLAIQVEGIALDRFGDLVKLQSEKNRRKGLAYDRQRKRKVKETVLRKMDEVERTPEAALEDDGTKGFSRKRKDTAYSAGSTTKVMTGRHIHSWNEEWYDDSKKSWRRKCSECGMTCNFEKI